MITHIVSYITNMYYYILYRIRTRNKDEDSLVTIVELSQSSEECYIK